MEPIPETVEAFRELAKYGDTASLKAVRRISVAAAVIVPELVGLSFAVMGEGVTFTLVASNDTASDLDAVQYFDVGPCVDSTEDGVVTTFHRGNALDEATWASFARATKAHGVESSLSLPIMSAGQVVAGVNLYASTVTAFDRHHHALAAACGAWEPGIVTNADLEFRSRTEAVKAPDVLRDQDTVNTAIGVIGGAQGIDLEEARRRLERAALRANISLARAARAILPVFTTGS